MISDMIQWWLHWKATWYSDQLLDLVMAYTGRLYDIMIGNMIQSIWLHDTLTDYITQGFRFLSTILLSSFHRLKAPYTHSVTLCQHVNTSSKTGGHLSYYTVSCVFSDCAWMADRPKQTEGHHLHQMDTDNPSSSSSTKPQHRTIFSVAQLDMRNQSQQELMGAVHVKQERKPLGQAASTKEGTQAKILLCEYCDASFASAGGLSKHRMAVHLQRKFTCHVCGKQYTRKETLKFHMAVHCQPPL